MTKKLFTLCLMLMAATVSIMAEDYGIYVGGVQVTSSNASNVTGSDIEAYNSGVNGGNPSVVYDKSTNTLTLWNVMIRRTGSNNRAIYNKSCDGLKIVLEGNNSFSATDASPLRFEKNTTIISKKDWVDGAWRSSYVIGGTQDAVTVVGSQTVLTLDGANLVIQSRSSCFEGDNYPSLYIVNSEITASANENRTNDCYALKSFGRLSLDNSTVSLTGYEIAVNDLSFLDLNGYKYDFITPDLGVGYGNYGMIERKVVFYAYRDENISEINIIYDPKTVILKPSKKVTDFPDVKFQDYLLNNVEAAYDGYLTIDEFTRSVLSIDITHLGISDLTGIELFTGLTFLDCSNNDLTTLDLSQNKNLKTLICYNNKLTSLKIPTNSKLTYLDIHDNAIDWPSMNAIVSNLPTANGEMRARYYKDGTAMSKQQVTALKNKGWTVLWYGGNGLVAYEGDSGVEINETNFPDGNFRSCLLNEEYGKDGYLTSNELKAVKELDVHFSLIQDMKGIEHFQALEVLICSENVDLTSLDISKNTALKKLDCGRCYKLSSLNVSNNTKLETLKCENCNLKSLDVSNNKALKILNCSENDIKSLNVLKNTNLEVLFCTNCGLTSLNVKNNLLLKRLYVSNMGKMGEINELTSLDVSKNVLLTELDCSQNKLTSLNLQNNTKLYSIWIYGNQIKVGAMETLVNSLHSNTIEGETKFIVVYRGLLIDGNIITVTDDNIITQDQVWIALNKGWKVSKDNIGTTSDYPGTEYHEINPTNFPDKNFRDFLLAQDYGKDGYLITEEIETIKVMDVSEKGIQDLTGIKHFTALEELNCSKNSLQSLNVMSNKALKKLNCGRCGLNMLNLSYSKSLVNLTCHMNNFKSLDLSKCTELKELLCNDNSLTTLDVSKNTLLETLICSQNKLTSLDLSQNTKLKNLKIWKNQIKGVGMEQLVNSLPQATNGSFEVIYGQPRDPQDNFITKSQVNIAKNKGWSVMRTDLPNYYNYDGEDVGVAINSTNFPDANFCSYLKSASFNNKDGNTSYLSEEELKAATTISVNGKSIKNLKGIEHFMWLKTLNCYSNSLGSLDLTGNSALTTLDCNNAGLTSLDVSMNSELTVLKCYSNSLTSLDVSNNKKLTELSCSTNQLTSLDITENTELKTLKCNNNKLTSLNPYCNTKLETLWCYANQINIGEMNTLVYNLRTIPTGESGILQVVRSSSSGTDNTITPAQVTIATNKGWKVQKQGGSTYSGNNTSIPINEANFPDKNFREYIKGNININGDGNDYLSIEELASVTSLSVDGENIGNLTGIEYFTELTTLDVSQNSLTTLDVSNNKKLKSLYCNDNGLTSLDVSNNPELKYLWCHNNNLTSLYVSNHAVLQTLSCWGNNLTSLDVSNCPALTTLMCYQNKIRGAKMDNLVNTLPTVPSGKTGTFEVNYAKASPDMDNVITPAQVDDAKTKNWKVKIVKTSTSSEEYSGAIEINATNFPDGNFRAILSGKDVDIYQDGYLTCNELQAVTELKMDGQGIWSLKGIEHFTELTTLNCSNNSLTVLDISKLWKLKNLYCNDNNLSSLSLTKNVTLENLDCYNNSLTLIQFGGSVTQIKCSGNQIMGGAMDNLVSNLSINGGVLYVKDDECSPENVITAAQVTSAKNKGWSVRKYDGDGHFRSYAGLGDISGDYQINEKDRDTLVKIIMGQRPEGIGTYAGDLNNDQKTDAADVVIMTNILNGK